MKVFALIPARLNSKRLPKKLMLDLGGIPIINRTYINVLETKLFDKVVVVTNSKLIYNSVAKIGGDVFYSNKKHTCGTDRIAEYAIKFNPDIVVNVQGDEPFIKKQILSEIIDVFKKDKNKEIDLVSVMNDLKKDGFKDANKVKVLVNQFNDAIMFSRSLKNLNSLLNSDHSIYKHVGVYGFRIECLRDFYESDESNLEKIENLEQLRYIEKGKTIRMVKTDYSIFGIDAIDDLIEARKKIND
tara:strand:- start:3 stop:731 length:729 start_codon:yes stop_codon:yes gene_type:complete